MKVFNTLSGKKEEFVPQGDEVTMYVCGINPYADAHIGHAMSYIFFDVVRRYLEFRGYKVKHVQNITDIEDNIIAHANEQGVSVPELTQKYVERYDEDMAVLDVLPAHVYPRAMGEIDKMIEIVQGLIDKSFAYAVGGNVYFRVRNVPDYGKLSKRSLEQMRAGARIEVGEDKEDPMDFLLWKESKPGEPSWDSPWGKGRPGWHIECSAMSIKYLGEQIDIHGGGQDVVFPHHENEIAQSESFTGKKPFVKYWLHNGLLKMHETDEAKMSRSLGNLITIREALEKYSADAIRLFVLSSYYRSPLAYSEEILEATERGAERLLRAAASRVPRPLEAKLEAGTYRERFIEAMDDDFGTAQAIAVLFDLAREINRADEEGMDVSDAQQTLRELGSDVLGLKFEFRVTESSSFEAELYNRSFPSLSLEEYSTMQFEDIRRRIKTSLPRLEKHAEVNLSLLQSLRNEFSHGKYTFLDKAQESTEQYSTTLNSLREQVNNATKPSDLGHIQASLSLLADCSAANVGSYGSLRDELRKEKHWKFADLIRDRLAEEDYFPEDTHQGTVWKRKR